MFVKIISQYFLPQKPTIEWIKCTTRRYTILYLLSFAFFLNILHIIDSKVLGGQFLSYFWISYYILILSILSFLISTLLYTCELDSIQQELTHTIRSLISGIRNLSPQEPGQKLCINELSCDDELQEVVAAINTKSEQIQSHIDYLKKLIGYMQHEFWTPLAIAQLHIDRAQKKWSDIYESLIWIKDEIKHMGGLVTAMALLVEADSSDVEKESCDMIAIVTKITQQMQELYPSTSFTINTDKHVLVDANKQYAWSICRNIIENAIKHGSDEVVIDVREHHLQITDTWDGIAANEIEHIWLPFWKKQRKTWHKEWFWLWLSLVRLLITKLWWDIEIIQPEWSWVVFKILY